MGRRALPRIDPTVDVSRHLVDASTLPKPGQPFPAESAAPPSWPLDAFDPKSWFADPSRPLEIEVGSGKGLFMNSASRAMPERNFLGIEIATKYARFAAHRLAKENRTNGIMVHGDAQAFFADRVRDGYADAVHVYFPDPWWKKRHHKRRIMNPSFVKQIERVLRLGGRLHFWTDVEEYFQEALVTLAEHTRLAGPFEVPELPPTHDLDYRTHFERRMRLHELAVYRAEFERTA